jgi:hypothetical protein
VFRAQHWAELRRMRFDEGQANREIRRRTGLHRETIGKALCARCSPSSALRRTTGHGIRGRLGEVSGSERRAGGPMVSRRIRAVRAGGGGLAPGLTNWSGRVRAGARRSRLPLDLQV